MTSPPPLVERKQKAARERIVRAAADLFAEHGFANVSVSDIADRAEVGRTTFFRYFGDKQEVVFAREAALLEALTAERLGPTSPDDRSMRAAVEAVQPLVLHLCAQISAEPGEYLRHEQLVEAHVELRGRSAAKAQLIARRMAALLVDEGWGEGVALLAGQIGLACFAAARASFDRAEDLVPGTRTAFERVLSLGA